MQNRWLFLLQRLALATVMPLAAVLTFWGLDSLLLPPAAEGVVPPAPPPAAETLTPLPPPAAGTLTPLALPPSAAGPEVERTDAFLADAVYLAARTAAAATGSSGGPAIFDRLAAAVAADAPGLASHLAPLRRLYGQMEEGFWTGAEGLLPRGRLLAARLAEAAAEGLDPADYFPAAIAARLERRDPAGRAELELLLSAAFLIYIQDVSRGREQHPLSGSLARVVRPTALEAAAELLHGSLSAADFALALDALPPPHPGYRRLKGALADLRRQAAEGGGWKALPSGPKLKAGMRSAAVPHLRQRLEVLEGRALPTEDPLLFDRVLSDALRQAQRRFGLAPDGELDRRTRAALDRSLEARMAEIRRNLDRWRALPRDLGPRHLVVNIPDFRLAYIEDDQERFSMAIAVGRPSRPTPIFSSEIDAVVMNPTWTVPQTIAREDILPRLRRDPQVLTRLRMAVYDGSARPLDPEAVDWWSVSERRAFPYRLVQRPGRGNALGRVKFQLPNPYSVYLHDTPGRGIFSRSWRAVSSGCVRVGEPERLARLLVAGTALEAGFDSIWRSKTTRKLALSEKLPIHFTYFTVFLDDSGLVQFRNDLYDRNRIRLGP